MRISDWSSDVCSSDLEAWETIETESGLAQEQLRRAGDIYMAAGSVICCWGMGITQHKHSVAPIQMLVNLLLLRGNPGRPGAGACPVRGHSNVHGDRTHGHFALGQASCRERGCRSVSISVVAGSLKK